MTRKIKFALDMGNGYKVRTLDDLREHYTIKKILEYFFDGRLEKWLADRLFDDMVASIKCLDKNNTAFLEKLHSILGIDLQDEISTEQINDIYIHTKKLEKLRKITSDEAILSKVDAIAFDQKDLDRLSAKQCMHIYLCGEQFYIDKSIHNIYYEGICNYTPKITSEFTDRLDLKHSGIIFKNVILPEGLSRLFFNNLQEQDSYFMKKLNSLKIMCNDDAICNLCKLIKEMIKDSTWIRFKNKPKIMMYVTDCTLYPTPDYFELIPCPKRENDRNRIEEILNNLDLDGIYNWKIPHFGEFRLGYCRIFFNYNYMAEINHGALTGCFYDRSAGGFNSDRWFQDKLHKVVPVIHPISYQSFHNNLSSNDQCLMVLNTWLEYDLIPNFDNYDKIFTDNFNKIIDVI